MSNVNKIILVGDLGKDPELLHTAKGHPYTKLNLATSRKIKDAGGLEQKYTEWHRVFVWGNHAEACVKYLRSGARVYVEGELRFRTVEEDGKERRLAEVHADTVTFLGSQRRETQETREAETAPALAMAN